MMFLCPGSETKFVQVKKANITNRQNIAVYKVNLMFKCN